MSRQSKNMRFAEQQRGRRLAHRIIRENKDKLGFIGAINGLKLELSDGKTVHLRPGAMYFVAKKV